jgi:hypothetical protein
VLLRVSVCEAEGQRRVKEAAGSAGRLGWAGSRVQGVGLGREGAGDSTLWCSVQRFGPQYARRSRARANSARDLGTSKGDYRGAIRPSSCGLYGNHDIAHAREDISTS